VEREIPLLLVGPTKQKRKDKEKEKEKTVARPYNNESVDMRSEISIVGMVSRCRYEQQIANQEI